MKCSKCGFENADNLKFCNECGQKLTIVCPSCNAVNQPGSKFCGGCGHNIAIPSETTRKELSFDEKLEKIQKYLPKGITEKSHLTYAYMCRTFDRYRQARQALRDALRPLSETGYKRIAFYGTGEAAEVAYLCLREVGLDLSAVFEGGDGETFLGSPVRRVAEFVPAEFDRIVVTSFISQEETDARVEELLRLGALRDQIVTLHR